MLVRLQKPMRKGSLGSDRALYGEDDWRRCRQSQHFGGVPRLLQPRATCLKSCQSRFARGCQGACRRDTALKFMDWVGSFLVRARAYLPKTVMGRRTSTDAHLEWRGKSVHLAINLPIQHTATRL